MRCTEHTVLYKNVRKKLPALSSILLLCLLRINLFIRLNCSESRSVRVSREWELRNLSRLVLFNAISMLTMACSQTNPFGFVFVVARRRSSWPPETTCSNRIPASIIRGTMTILGT